MMTGSAKTGILHLVNQIPFDWYSKKQGAVEIAKCGLEFLAGETATDQLIDH